MEIQEAIKIYDEAEKTIFSLLPKLEADIKEGLGLPKAAELLGLSRMGLSAKFKEPQRFKIEELKKLANAVQAYKDIFKG